RGGGQCSAEPERAADAYSEQTRSRGAEEEEEMGGGEGVSKRGYDWEVRRINVKMSMAKEGVDWPARERDSSILLYSLLRYHEIVLIYRFCLCSPCINALSSAQL